MSCGFVVPDKFSGNACVDKFQQLSSSCSDLVAGELRAVGRASSASAGDGPFGNTGDLTLLIFAVVVVASRVLPLLPSITANCWHTTSFQQSLTTRQEKMIPGTMVVVVECDPLPVPFGRWIIHRGNDPRRFGGQ